MDLGVKSRHRAAASPWAPLAPLCGVLSRTRSLDQAVLALQRVPRTLRTRPSVPSLSQCTCRTHQSASTSVARTQRQSGHLCQAERMGLTRFPRQVTHRRLFLPPDSMHQGFRHRSLLSRFDTPAQQNHPGGALLLPTPSQHHLEPWTQEPALPPPTRRLRPRSPMVVRSL